MCYIFAVCSSSSYFANGNAVSNGSVISYICSAGYSLNGASQRSCQDDGSGWSLVEPTCSKRKKNQLQLNKIAIVLPIYDYESEYRP